MTTESDWQKEIRALLSSCRIGFLATQGKESPETSMAPYALYHDSVLLHLSRLARHTANVQAHPMSGFMICAPESSMDSPLALPRLSLQGNISPVPIEEQIPAQKAYLRAIAEAKPLFDFADFQLFRLKVVNIRWVGGFGSARDIPLNAWGKITTSGEGN